VFGGDLQIDPEADAVDYITGSIMREHEKKVADTTRNAANYPGNHVTALAGATKWSDYTFVTPGDPYSVVSNPVADLRHAVQRIWLDTGRYPNTLVIPFDAVGVVENHPRVVARFQYTALTDPNAWKALMGFPAEITDQINVYIVDSRINSADNVDVAENIVSLWGQDVWMGVVDATPGQKTFTFGKTFAQIYPNGTTRPSDRWREENRKADIVRTSYKYDLKIVSSLAGFLFTNAVAAIT
jgi:hypothetical protein